jgi:hypothetical protein
MSTNTIYQRGGFAGVATLEKMKADFSRLAQVVTAPRAAFESVAARPKFLLPFLLCVATVFATNYAVVSRIGIGPVVAANLKSHPRASHIVEVVERHSVLSSLVWNANMAISTAVTILFVAALFALLLNVTTEASWRKVFSVVAHAMFGYFFVSGALTVLVVILRPDFNGFDLNNPVATNLALFISGRGTNPFLYHLAASADVLSFWLLFLLAAGFSAAVPRLTLRASLVTVAAPWAFYVLCKGGVALLQAG